MKIEDDILIVDDEIPNLRLLAELLEKEGYQVRPTEKAQTAIDSALAKPPGLILLDVRMPEMDGFELCRRLKQDKRTQHVPIIFVSVLQDIEARLQGFEAGGVDFISKPFQELEILARVRTHMRLHRMQRHLEQLVDERTSELSESKASLEQKFRELRESDERYELAVTGSAAGIWDWDIASDKIHYSERFKELLGYAHDELSGTQDEFWNRLHPDDYEAARLAVDKHLKKGVPYIIDYRLRAKSGEYRWFHARGQALWDETGKATRMSGSLIDITERKRIEEELKKSEHDKSLILNSTSEIIAFHDLNHNFQWVNKAYLEATGLSLSKVIGQKCYHVWGLDRLCINCPVTKALKTGEPHEAELTPQNQEHWPHDQGCWTVRAAPVKNDDGSVIGAIEVAYDITERKKTEEEARIQREALARVDRATRMGQLTGSIAHELNQPLTGILSNAQAAELMIKNGKWERDELAKIMTEIAADSKRAGDVIRNLRELYREQKGEFLPVDINAVVNETTQLLNSEFVTQHIVLTTECTPSIPMVNGNRIQIEQVLVNLIMNGIQAMSSTARDDRHLHTATAYDASEIKAWVEDSGPGIDAEKINRIFEPLTTWKPGGTGMGLALSNSIIEAHGGRMWAENRPEGGVRIGFALPILKESQKA